MWPFLVYETHIGRLLRNGHGHGHGHGHGQGHGHGHGHGQGHGHGHGHGHEKTYIWRIFGIQDIYLTYLGS
jgi:hypothetical protein